MTSRYRGTIVVAAMSTGFAMALAGCGPASVTAGTSRPQGSAPSAASGGGTRQTTDSIRTSDVRYSFRTLGDPADPSFNQLLGISDGGLIAGYSGSGAAGHPNKGYVLVPASAAFAVHGKNVPGSAQTQVTGVNARGTTAVGFFSGTNNANQVNANTGFYTAGGSFHGVVFPATDNASPPVNQLLGVNDSGVAAGFYTDARGNSHGYTYSIHGGRFAAVRVPGAASVTAAAISDSGTVAGFFVSRAGTTKGFTRTRGGHVTTLSYPGASITQALGVNDSGEVVGTYTVGTGGSAATHGFTWSPRLGFQTVDDPHGMGTTTVNGVNDRGDLVGFYTDGAGNTDGFAAVPAGQPPLPAAVQASSPSSPPSASASHAPAAPAPSSPSSPSRQPSAPPQPTNPPAPAPSSGGTPPVDQPVHW